MHINVTKTHRFKNLLPLFDNELVPFMPSKKAVKLDTGSAAGGAPWRRTHAPTNSDAMHGASGAIETEAHVLMQLTSIIERQRSQVARRRVCARLRASPAEGWSWLRHPRAVNAGPRAA